MLFNITQFRTSRQWLWNYYCRLTFISRNLENSEKGFLKQRMTLKMLRIIFTPKELFISFMHFYGSIRKMLLAGITLLPSFRNPIKGVQPLSGSSSLRPLLTQTPIVYGQQGNKRLIVFAVKRLGSRRWPRYIPNYCML